MPGVPDVYQGCEVVARHLVDPDNRRPVDYDALRERLHDEGTTDRVRSSSLDEELSAAKLSLTSKVLHLRRDQPHLFGAEAAYHPLPSSPDVVAFARSHGDAVLVTVASRPGTGSGQAEVTLPDGRWTSLLDASTRRTQQGGRRQLVDLCAAPGVALLIKETTR